MQFSGLTFILYLIKWLDRKGCCTKTWHKLVRNRFDKKLSYQPFQNTGPRKHALIGDTCHSPCQTLFIQVNPDRVITCHTNIQSQVKLESCITKR